MDARVVVTLTTLPDRYSVLHRTLKALHAQDTHIDAIYLGVPRIARRLNKEYPPLPPKITELCTVVPIDTDYGPATKLCGALLQEDDPNTIIISCDDDCIHDPRLVSTLVRYATQYPQACICGTGALIGRGLHMISIVSSISSFRSWNGITGFNVPKEGRDVDLIFGVAGVLYRRGFFPAKDKLDDELFHISLDNTAIYMNDDVLFSGYLSRRGIKRKVFYDIPSVQCNDSGAGDALSGDMLPMIQRMNKSIMESKNYGLFPTMEPLTVNETVAWKGIITLLIIILIGLLVYVMFRY